MECRNEDLVIVWDGGNRLSPLSKIGSRPQGPKKTRLWLKTGRVPPLCPFISLDKGLTLNFLSVPLWSRIRLQFSLAQINPLILSCCSIFWFWGGCCFCIGKLASHRRVKTRPVHKDNITPKEKIIQNVSTWCELIGNNVHWPSMRKRLWHCGRASPWHGKGLRFYPQHLRLKRSNSRLCEKPFLAWDP